MAKKLTYEEVRSFIEKESDSGCKLLSTEYKNSKTKLELKCKCRKIFETSWNQFQSRNKRQCNECGRESSVNKMSKTHVDFVREIYKLFGREYSVIGRYRNTHTKIKIKHNKCGNVYETVPKSILRGHGCSICADTTKTMDQFKQEIYELVNSEYAVLDEYVNDKNHIKMKHNECGYIWDVTPNHFLRGSRCPKCARTLTRTHNEFVFEIEQIFKDKYTVIGKYKNTKSKILMRHNACGNEWMGYPTNLLRGKGCPKCKGLKISEKSLLTKKEFQARFNNRNVDDEYVLISDYNGMIEEIEIKHNLCKHTFSKRAMDFLGGSGCPYCYRTNTLTHEIFLFRLKNVHGEGYEVLSDYKGYHEMLKVKHNKCGYEWDVRPDSLLAGTGCPKCNESKGENAISSWLDGKIIAYTPQYKFDDCKNILPLPFDFAIFDNKSNLKLLIEYDGEMHFKSIDFFGGDEKFKERQSNDRIKDQYCEQNNIPLLRIPYWKFDNIEKILDKELKKYNLIKSV